MTTLYSDLDPRTELEQTVAADLTRAITKRGATVKHHGTSSSHAPSTAPADITVDWLEGTTRHRLLVEVAKRNDESEFTSIVQHLDNAIAADPSTRTDVPYSGLSTSVRMARFLRNENQRRAATGIPGRIVFLALDRLQDYLARWASVPTPAYPLVGLRRAVDRWADFATDVAAAQVFQVELFPDWSDKAFELDAAQQRELAIRQERLRKDIVALENKLREKGVTGQRAHKFLIYLFFLALYEDKLGTGSRATSDGFKAYKKTISPKDKADAEYRDRTVHHLFQTQIAYDPEVILSRLLDQYERIDLDDDFIVSNVLPIFDRYPLSAGGIDFIGAVFEALARRAEKDNRIGQFFTPETAVIATVRLTAPRPTDTVLDPACGTARFLIHAMDAMLARAEATPTEPKQEVERRIREERLLGTDIDPWVATIAKMNMYLHGDGKSNVRAANGLALSASDVFAPRTPSRAHEAIDVSLTNPPLGDINFRAVAADLARAGLLGPLTEAPGTPAYNVQVEQLAAAWTRERLSVVPHTCIEEEEVERQSKAVAKWDAARLEAAKSGDAKAERSAARYLAAGNKKLDDAKGRIAAGRLTYEPAGSTAKGGALFLSAILDYLKPERTPGAPEEWRGGFVGIVVDEAVLNTAAYAHARAFITSNYFVKAVVSLPRNAFEFLAKTTAKTSIIVLARKPDTDVQQREPVFYARAETIGYTSTGVDKRNDLPAIVEAFTHWRDNVILAWTGGLPHPAKIAAAVAGTPTLGGSISLYQLDPARPGERLDFAYRRMRELVAAMHTSQPLGAILQEAVRHPKGEATDAEAVVHMYAWVSSVDGRVRTRGEQDLKYAARDLRVLAENDILVSGIDAVRGAIGVVGADCTGNVVSKEFFTLEVRPELVGKVAPHFIARLLRSPRMRAIIEGAITGVSNRTRIESAAELLKLPVPMLPSLTEQEKVAAQVKAAFAAQDDAAKVFVSIDAALGS